MLLDSQAFVLLAALLVLVTRGLPRGPALLAHAAVSLGAFALLLPGAPSLAFGLAFVFAPRLLVALLGPERAVAAVVGVQALAVLWLRRYAALIPGLGELAPFAHPVAVVGASYIVLRQIQWAMHRERRPADRGGLAEYTAFLLSGFTLLAGPIVAFDAWRAGFRAEDDILDGDALLSAGHRIVRGYLKVAVLGPILAELSSVAGVEAAGASAAARAVSFYVYPLFLYVNFAGYCDVVIGLGRLAGVRLPENFDRPFVSTNIQEFWQRWHITFSNWARDHVGYPLQLLLRRRRWPARRSLIVSVTAVFTFVGLWHGARWGFVLFGVLHALAVLAVPAWKALEPRLLGERARAWLAHSRSGWALRWVLCFHFLCATMVLFDRSLAEAWWLLSGG